MRRKDILFYRFQTEIARSGEKIDKMQDSDSRIKETEKGYLLVSNLYSLPKILGEVLRGMFKVEVIHSEYSTE